MFRELVNYCVTAISSSGVYSIIFQHDPTHVRLFVCFWTGNVLYRVCIGTGPRGVLIPRRILDLISSFLSLLEQPPSCISVLGGGDKLGNCLASTLPGNRRPKIVKTYGPADFEKSLEKPTTQIIERHDFRSILDYLLMKLRTALDRDWLHSLPTLHKVGIFLRAFVLVSMLKIIPIFRF